MPCRISPLLFATAVTAGCVANSVTLEPRTDAIIATNIKARLVDDDSVAAAAIRVDSDQGTVTLSGFVATKTERQRAAALAQTEPAAKAIINRLVIK